MESTCPCTWTTIACSWVALKWGGRGKLKLGIDWCLRTWFTKAVYQGRNEVYFFVADPVFYANFLIPDPKSDENFDPWSHKILTPDPWAHGKHADPDPEGFDPGSEAVIPDPTLF